MAKATPKMGFHRPHPRVQYTGELVNQVTGEVFTPPSRTKQSFAEECDINNILKQYRSTGMINHISAKARAGQFVDLPGDLDFQDAMNTVIQAEQAFAALPSKVRDRFHNSPAEFLMFMQDPANEEEAGKLGLLEKPAGVVTPEPPPREPETPPPEATPSPAAGGTGG